MSQDSFGRYTGTGRPINEMGHTTPQVEFSPSERPAVGLLPAPYVPAGRFDEHKRSNVVFSPGVPVGLDTRGNLVPAGIPGGHVFEYTTLDFRTGLPATRNANTGAAIAAAGTAAMNSGLTNDVTGEFIRPIGITSYLVYQHEGGVSFTDWSAYTLNHDNPVNYAVHNTMAQDRVAVTCDYTIQVPYIYGKNLLSDDVKIFDNSSDEIAVLTADAKSYPFAHDELIADVSTVVSGTITNLEVVYVSPGQGVGDNGADDNTVQERFGTIVSGASDGLGGLVQYRAPGGSAGTAVSLSVINGGGLAVLADGTNADDYIVIRNPKANREQNLAGAVTAIADVATVSADTHFNFSLAPTLQPGDFVVCREGRYIKYDRDRHEKDEIIGQCLRRDDNAIKKDYLDRVKTAYERSSSVVHKMAGSATRGVPYLLNLVTDAAQVQFETKKTLAGATLSETGMPSSLPLSLVVINVLR